MRTIDYCGYMNVAHAAHRQISFLSRSTEAYVAHATEADCQLIDLATGDVDAAGTADIYADIPNDMYDVHLARAGETSTQLADPTYTDVRLAAHAEPECTFRIADTDLAVHICEIDRRPLGHLDGDLHLVLAAPTPADGDATTADDHRTTADLTCPDGRRTTS